MKIKLHALCIACALTIATVFTPIYVSAEEKIKIVGIVTDIQGQRIEIESGAGARIWVTTEQPISENAVGLEISGYYILLGDSYLLIDFSFFSEQ